MVDTTPWPGLRLGAPLSGGAKSRVWAAELGGERVVVRHSRRSADSLAWELDLMAELDGAGFVVPTVREAEDGRPSVDGVIVQSWIDGRPPSSASHWQAVAAELQRLHRLTEGHPQRPSCVTVPKLGARRRSVDADLDAIPDEVEARVVEVFTSFTDVGTGVVHGDPGPGNLRITEAGRVGFLDWDESRVDLVWHDLSDLGVQVLDDESHRRAQRLSDAWEAANAWIAEPEYARRRFARLD
ncbi:MAG: aminoglycoside phosphotransferase family protein [Actinomycetota bacterium]